MTLVTCWARPPVGCRIHGGWGLRHWLTTTELGRHTGVCRLLTGTSDGARCAAADPQKFTTMQIMAERVGDFRPNDGRLVLTGKVLPG